MGKGELTRQNIIAKAAPIFNRRGYEGSSMRDILDATGLEKGGLYRHFSGKEELAVEAFRYSLEQAQRARTGHLDQVPGAVEKLRFMIRRFVEVPSSVPGGCPLMNTAIDADDGNPALRRLALEGIRDWRNRLARIVRQGIEQGEIRADVEPRSVANTIIAALEGALMISRLEGSRVALRDAQSSLHSILKGIEAA